VKRRALSKERFLLKFFSGVIVPACCRIFSDARGAFGHGFVLTYAFFDSGLCNCQALIMHDCFGYKSIKRDRAKEPSESK
jgi:hypothetical protein